MDTRDIVFILGAGASKSEGAPLQKEVFQMFFEYEKQLSWSTEEYSDQITEIKKYLRDFYGIGVDTINVNFPTFEEALGVIDYAVIKNESFKGWSKDRLIKLRNSLVFAIAKTLDESLTRSNHVHQRLIDRLKKYQLLNRVGFISLNYDIAIDNVLIPLYPSIPIEYGIDFINYGRPNDFRKPIGENSIPLFKIHGSLNWLYCPTCNQVERKNSKATQAFYKSEPCSQCKTNMEPMTIPPSFSKDMSNTYIKDVFTKSEILLRNAKHIIFCGYSFPDADLHFKYLLKKAELYSVEPPNIYVVDPDSADDFKNKYYRFLKAKNRIQFVGDKFEVFVNSFDFRSKLI